MNTTAEQLSEICTACGMCCDGTLFRKANIKHEDDRLLAESLGLTTGMKNERQHFLLPCHHFNKQCTIYERKRPHICSAYFCEPIRKVKRQQMPFSEAEAVIAKAVRLNRQFAAARVHFPEFADMSILEIRNELNFSKLPTEQQIQMRKKYAPLLLIGIHLFPLILEIIGPRRTKKEPSA